MQSVPAENNGGALAADIALCMELITFGGFGTPSGLLLFWHPGFFGVRGRSADYVRPVSFVPARDYFPPTSEPNSLSAASHFLRSADLRRLTAPQG